MLWYSTTFAGASRRNSSQIVNIDRTCTDCKTKWQVWYFKHILAEPVPTSTHTKPPAYHPHKRPVGTDHELNPANQHKAIASICEINKDQYMKMSALMPETPGNPRSRPRALPVEPAQGYSIDMYDQWRSIYVDVSTHARDDQETHVDPTVFPSAQTRHQKPGVHQCKHKRRIADIRSRALYIKPRATMPTIDTITKARQWHLMHYISQIIQPTKCFLSFYLILQ